MKKTICNFTGLGLLCFLIASCGVGTGSSTGEIGGDLGVLTSEYIIVDLDNGAMNTAITIPDLLSNPVYRTSKMVFRTITAGSVTTGAAVITFGAQTDEVPTTASYNKFYIGVFEVTQAQWIRLAGASSTPWTAAEVAAVNGSAVGDQIPAYGMSRDSIDVIIAANAARWSFRVALPSALQWECACRSGTTTVFSWGDLGATPTTTAATYARVAETALGVNGPEIVGNRTPNGLGLYDMHGNVWEWIDGGTGTIRGGSWRDSLSMSRSANKQDLDRSIAHALVGLRLVLIP